MKNSLAIIHTAKLRLDYTTQDYILQTFNKAGAFITQKAEVSTDVPNITVGDSDTLCNLIF